MRGNVERCLKLKRNKAERTLALCNVLYQLANPNVQLAEHQTQLLKKEASLITFRLENKKEHPDFFS